VRGGPPLHPLRHGCRVPGSGSGTCPGGSAYPNTMPSTSVVPSQPLIDALNCVHNSWWPDIPEAGFSNSNDGLDPSEYGGIWSSLNGPLSENGFQQLPEIPQAAGGESFQDFSAGVIQGLEDYGEDLEVFNQQSSTPSAKEKKAFPQPPPTVLHSTDLPSLAFVVTGHPVFYVNPLAPAPVPALAPTLAPRSRKGCWYASFSSFSLGILTIFYIF